VTRPRAVGLAATLATLVAVAACGSSATTSTAPTPLVRCAITLNVGAQSFPPEGGNGLIGVSATRECTWSVAVEGGGWLSLKSSQTGQGDGTVEFAASANPDPVVRRGALVLNGQRAEITQTAAQCATTLSESSASFAPAGGSGRVDVRASSGLCAWSASSDQPWIEIRSGVDGRGNGSVSFDVAPTTGPPRIGTLTIAGQRFSVTQSEGCSYSIAPAAINAGADGGGSSIAVTTAPGCPWTAVSNVNWITFGQGIGVGPGTIPVTVQPTAGPARTGTAVVAGEVFTVTQAPGCTFQVQPSVHSIGSGGGTATVNISTAAGCGWTAGSDVPWITIQSMPSGAGNGLVSFAVGPTTGPARSGTLTVAGQKVTVNQGQGCSYSISPTQESIPSAGGGGRVGVTTGNGCAWTASSSVPWITIQSGSTGNGSGAVNYTVAATTGPARSGRMDIAGQAFTINQGQGCSFTIAPASATVPNGGGPTSFEVQSSAGCAWSASTPDSWITITAGGTGSGTGTVQLSVAPNTGAARTGTVNAGGKAFTVNQGQGCTYTLVPASVTVPDAGGPTSFEVQSPAGCAWTASSQASWITLGPAGPGNGNGTVQMSVAANTGPGRSGTVTVADKTFTVMQGGGCSYTLTPPSENVPAAGGSGTVAVTAAAGCPWTATSGAAWLSLTGATSGSGDGSVAYSAAPNTGAARSGTLTIGTRTFTVNQAGGCTFTVAPETVAMLPAGGPVRVDVTTAADCAWTAATVATWITIAGGAGTGTGGFDLTIAPNTGPARSGAVTIGGRTVTVNQESGCTFAINPTSVTIPVAGGPGSVNVTAAAGCTWTATSQIPWIAISSGSAGSGDGVVQITVEANATGAPRTATITIATHTFTVRQD
jgi:hypothetical protein